MGASRRRALALALLSLVACGTSPRGPSTEVVVLAHPPADPGGPPPDPSAASSVSVYAIRRLWLGDVDPATGQASPEAWEALGFDIDGKVTTRSSTDVCTLAPHSSTFAQQDGQGGVDNSWGSNILPLLAGLMNTDVSTRLNASLSAGDLTDLVVVRGLGGAATASPLSASLVVAAPLGQAPTWSAQDTWPVDSSSLFSGAGGFAYDDAGVLDGGDPSPLLAFGQAYEVGGVVVAEPPSGAGEIALGIVQNTPFIVPVRHVQIQMTVSPDGSSATRLVLSGVIPMQSLLDPMRRIVQSLSPGECIPGLSVTIEDEIASSQDILVDGTNAPGAACDGISIGLGFEAVRVGMGPAVEVAPVSDGYCAPDGGS